MRGFPLIRGALVVVALLLLLIPLIRLTKTTAAPAVTAVPAETAKKSTVRLELTSSEAPFQYEVCHLGHVIWSGESTEHRVHKDVGMEFPKEGIDLEVKGSWIAEVPAGAVKLAVTRDDGEPQEQSVWATKTFDEVLTFH